MCIVGGFVVSNMCIDRQTGRQAGIFPFLVKAGAVAASRSDVVQSSVACDVLQESVAVMDIAEIEKSTIYQPRRRTNRVLREPP